MKRMAENTVRAIVWRCEGGNMAIAVDKDKVGSEEVRGRNWRGLANRGGVVAGREGGESRHMYSMYAGSNWQWERIGQGGQEAYC